MKGTAVLLRHRLPQCCVTRTQSCLLCWSWNWNWITLDRAWFYIYTCAAKTSACLYMHTVCMCACLCVLSVCVYPPVLLAACLSLHCCSLQWNYCKTASHRFISCLGPRVSCVVSLQILAGDTQTPVYRNKSVDNDFELKSNSNCTVRLLYMTFFY